VPSDAWAASDKAYSAAGVAALLARIDRAASASGERAIALGVAAAGERGDYPPGYAGHAVTLAPAGAGPR
jgi:hypothetical protein